MSRRSARRSSASGRPRKALILGGLSLFAAAVFYFGVQFGKPPPPPDFGALKASSETPPPPPASSTPSPGQSAADDPSVESSKPETPDRQMPPPTTVRLDDGMPRIALVIDDLGRSLQDLETLGRLGIPITYAVLPFESHTSEVVAELRRRGEEILCHLPMEAKGGNNPGPGALLSKMNRSELQAATEKALAAVPGAVGVNNHMGSSIASNQEAIEAVLSVVAASNLYYLDSRTSADTLAYTTARQMNLPAGERQVFLDTQRDTAAIQEQFDRLVGLARSQGQAIAIAHPYSETLEVLAERVPLAQQAGIEFVATSVLLDR